jgi:LuxR family transcriptional regulator, maltose regulon positive regulatory protein
MLASVLRTKIIPPPRATNTLSRPRVSQALQQALDHRLTILQAGAGYGKSTALADFAQSFVPLVWYQVHQEDNDPLVFLLHLNHAIRYAIPDIPNLPIETLEHWDGTRGPLPWKMIVDQVINALSEHLSTPVLLVIDDAHLVTENGDIPLLLDRLVGLSPASLHTLLSGRPPLSLPSLPHWRSKGETYFLDQSTLAFTTEEITTLYLHHYRLDLVSEEIENLLRYTEGWAIALQLVWQSIRNQPGWELPRHSSANSLDSLFDVLAREVFDRQPEDVREFLLATASLRELIPAACDHLRQSHDSAAMLAHLRRQDLFVNETAGGALRYHPIFHDFLRQQSDPARQKTWHQSAAGYFLAQDNPEAALFHLLDAGQWEQMADVLDSYAATLLTAGRLDTLDAYLASLPPETLPQHPRLLFTLGELARLHSRFDEARGWYEQAESTWRARNQPDGIARALRGRARVYLDIVDPLSAERLLEEAVRISDGSQDREAQVRLYELLAENHLNAGRVEEAERLRQRAEALHLAGPDKETLLFRVLLRTGRLHEARKALEERAKIEQDDPVQTPRAHRETLLVLSLVYSLMGLRNEALQASLDGMKRGHELKSPFVTAVGYMRQGSALNLFADERAQECFQQAIEISRSLSVARLRVEANWGLCRFYGYRGELDHANTCAQEAVTVAEQAGDEWIGSLVQVTMGASLNLAGEYAAAEDWLNRAYRGFQESSDPFGRVASHLWLAYSLFKQKKKARLEQVLAGMLDEMVAGDYAFIFLRPTLLGPPDERLFLPLLLYARKQGYQSAAIHRILEKLNLPGLDLHPGYQLRVQTLGGFQVWRGSDPIPPNAWRREKSKQLFQLLLTHRKTQLTREQICEFLWPESDPETAQRNFKVTLNTLYQVLEAEREPGEDSAFILREDLLYGLRPGADIWLDAEQFSRALQPGSGQKIPQESILQALSYYQGEYLPGALYEDWAAEERERLAALFLESADKLAESLLEHGRHTEAIDLCQRILAQDNCWERAYRYLMTAYDHLGNRGQVARVYQRCVQTLREELDVSPSPETEKLYQRLTGNA